MTCWETLMTWGLRSLGHGPRVLPNADITLCQQFVLIGSGMIWNLYFGVLALAFGFFASVAVAVGKAASRAWIRRPAEAFVFVFRGSPLFIQFFFAYELLVLLPRAGINVLGLTVHTSWMTNAWAGALVVLFLNTTAYAAEIFYGALRSVPKGDIEAAEAFGLTGWRRFRRVEWPTMLRLAWPAYTNEAIFLFHATALVYFSGFPAFRQQGDALYYAKHFVDKTFNPFIPYPIVGLYFILLTLGLVWGFGLVNARLNRHLPRSVRRKIRLRPQLIR